MGIQIDAYGGCVGKYGEAICGDKAEIIRGDAGVSAILADGTGYGAEANLLSSFAVQMMYSNLRIGEPFENIAEMIADSQPGGRGYTAFTLMQVLHGGNIYIAQMETPDVIILRHGKPVPVEMKEHRKRGKIIRECVLSCKDADTVFAFNGGIVSAGWVREEIVTYMTNAYSAGLTAEKAGKLLLNASTFLSGSKPKDDLSVLSCRIRRCKAGT